jgi:hypothetical protein
MDIDEETGTLELHCSQCGALLDPSSHFCGVCSAEVSGGHEVPPDVVDEAVDSAPDDDPEEAVDARRSDTSP